MIAAVLAGAFLAGALIRPALNHDAELPVSHTGKARR